jgi:PIF1-like helicase
MTNFQCSTKSIISWATESKLDENQRRAFETLTAAFVLSFYTSDATIDRQARSHFRMNKRHLQHLLHSCTWPSDQLICFLHGPAGSGKTAVIDLVKLYATSFCKLLWDDYNDSEHVIVVTAMTGVAATLLLGETTHSALYLNHKLDNITGEHRKLWRTTRMVIIDEISFACRSDLVNIHQKLCALKENIHSMYGGVHIIFSGDLRQLEPVGANKLPIYAEHVPEFKDWVNRYIELSGTWRFKNDIHWGALLSRLRNGTISSNDIDSINKHIASQKRIPHNIKFATYYNIDRDAINTAIFEERLKHLHNKYKDTNHFLVVFADNLYVKDFNDVYQPMQHQIEFWQNCSENDIKFSNGVGRMDPVLKLFVGCKVMLPFNINVREGLANGTQATIEQVILKHGQTISSTMVSDEIFIQSVFASQIDYVILKHSNAKIQESLFKIYPKQHTFKTKLPQHFYSDTEDNLQTVKMKAIQLPILLNSATTGHKLQGAGVDTLFVHNWSYSPNWVYVMLSRVTSMRGLYARNLLSTDLSKYAIKSSYSNMEADMRLLLPHKYTTEEYTLLSQHRFPLHVW